MTDIHTRTVLIADDDRDLVQALAVRCRGLGFDVYQAYDAYSALAVVKSRRPGLACLDVNMPAGNGLSVCEMLATDEEFATMPVIILTGKRDPDTIRRCHNLCAYYVEKCDNVWPRIQPILLETFDMHTAASASPAETDDAVASGHGDSG